jgi:peptide/nickel transport system permease protein
VTVEPGRLADTAVPVDDDALGGEGHARGFLRRLFSSKLSGFGVVLLAAMVLLVLVGPLLWRVDPNAQNLPARLLPPSGSHPFGTDALGRDVLSRVLHGGRLSLAIALACVLLALLSGALIGLAVGFVGGWVDSVVMRIMDVMLAIPSLLLAVAIAAALGPSIRSLILAVVIPNVPSDARLIRSVVLSVRERDYVFAARACGVRPSRIIARHVLPNSISTILTNTAILFGFTLLEIGALGYLGLGVQAPNIEWGVLLSDAETYIFNRPVVVLAPGLAIFVVALAANLVGDALRDAFDPTR